MKKSITNDLFSLIKKYTKKMGDQSSPIKGDFWGESEGNSIGYFAIGFAENL
ncbi:MAG: hypothetical protein PVI26_14265 [Chitinispirillia bacterium]